MAKNTKVVAVSMSIETKIHLDDIGKYLTSRGDIKRTNKGKINRSDTIEWLANSYHKKVPDEFKKFEW